MPRLAQHPLTIVSVQTHAQLEEIRRLFREYNDFLGFSLDFQNFERELADLPGKYAPPTGRLLLTEWEGKPAGCVALYRMEEGVCEIKRLFVRPEYTGRGLGRALFEAILEEAKIAGYTRIRLDSVRRLKAAENLYKAYGFEEIPPYNFNPEPDVYYMERLLS